MDNGTAVKDTTEEKQEIEIVEETTPVTVKTEIVEPVRLPVDDPAPSLLGEFWAFMSVRKKFWLAPIIIALVLLGMLFMLAANSGVVAPFVYAL